MKRIVAERAAALSAHGRCSTTVHRSSRCSRPAAPAKPRELVGPGPTRRGDGAHPDDRRAHARPRQALAVALRHRRATTSATRLRALLRKALAEDDPERDRPRTTQKEDEFAHYAGQLVVLVSAPVAGPQDPGVGAGAVVRRGRHEPAARGPRARLCRRLGDRLARLFGARPRAPSAGRASGSPASSSSATPAASSRSAPRPALATVCEAVAAAGDLEISD